MFRCTVAVASIAYNNSELHCQGNRSGSNRVYFGQNRLRAYGLLTGLVGWPHDAGRYAIGGRSPLGRRYRYGCDDGTGNTSEVSYGVMQPMPASRLPVCPAWTAHGLSSYTKTGVNEGNKMEWFENL